jgi:cytochrome b6-f complex iron-sulfur subunit
MTVPSRPGRSRLDPEPISRRDWLGLSSLWAMGGALLFGFIGMIRLPKAAVLSSPSRKFRVDLPDTLATGQPYVPPGRAVAVYRDAAGVHAISLICTHLGCIVRPTAAGFECPCHGSHFAADGSVTRGPAPAALPWFKVSVSDSFVTVDEGTTVPTGTMEG